MSFYVSTTGVVQEIVLNDLGKRILTHPVSNLDLELEYRIDDLRYSESLKNALANEWITAKDSFGNPINISNIEWKISDLTPVSSTSDSYTEITRDRGKISRIDVWDSVDKILKLNDSAFTYSGAFIIQEVLNVYSNNVLLYTKTSNIERDNSYNVINITESIVWHQ